MKVDILAIGVHPDDVELSCSGTLMKHIAMGYSVALVDLTQGELGTRGTAETRKVEAADAKEILGAVARENLKMADGFFQHNKENMLKIVEMIRHFQPEIVFTNAISDRHPDHGRAAKLSADACFYAGLQKIATSYRGKKQEKWRPKAVYHYVQDRYIQPDFVVDISEYMDRKIESILAYKTQFYNPDSKEPQTPISSKQFLNYVRGKDAFMGRAIMVDFAEGFTVNRTIGVDNIFDLK